MSIYDEMQAVAIDVMSEFKQGSNFYVEVTPGNGPAQNPGPSTKTRHEIAATVSGPGYQYVKDGLAVVTDLQLVMPGGGVVPKMNGLIESDGVTYKIKHIDPRPKSGTVVVYTIVFGK